MRVRERRAVAAGGRLCRPGGPGRGRVGAGEEGARGGTMGSPTLNEWGYSCRLVDLIARLLP